MTLPSAPPASPPPPLYSAAPCNPVLFLRQPSPKLPVVNPNTNDDDFDDDYAPYQTSDAELHHYAAAGIGMLVLSAIGTSLVAAYFLYAGWVQLFTIGYGFKIKDEYDDNKGNPNGVLAVTAISTIVALYETNSMSDIMHAALAKTPLWGESEILQNYLTFNTAVTLGFLAGMVAQGLMSVANEYFQKSRRNSMTC